MGLLWRLLAPKPVKSARRTVRKATHPVRTVTRAATPKPVKKLQRATWKAANPIEATRLIVEDSIVDGVRGSRKSVTSGKQRTVTPRAGQSPAPGRPTGPPGRSAMRPAVPSTYAGQAHVSDFMALRQRLEPGMLPMIESRLSDPDPTIREYALTYSVELHAPRAREHILAALDDEHPSNQVYAFLKLRDYLEPGMLPMIESRLSDPDPTIREYALTYSVELHAPRAREHILAALDDEHPSNQVYAFLKLRDYLEPGMLPMIESRLSDPDPTIREYAGNYRRQLMEG